MKIFVATEQTQGDLADDFCHAREGEIVTISDEHESDRECGACPCCRSVVGIETGNRTTTFKVAESELTVGEYISHVVEFLLHNDLSRTVDDAPAKASHICNYLLDMAARFPIGAVLHRRGEKWFQRMVEILDFEKYAMGIPPGEWLATYDGFLWGRKSPGLHLFFTGKDGQKRRTFLFWQEGRYGPESLHLDFRRIPFGTEVLMTAGLTRNNKTKMISCLPSCVGGPPDHA